MSIRMTTVFGMAIAIGMSPGVAPGEPGSAGPTGHVGLMAQARPSTGPPRPLVGPMVLEPGQPGLKVHVAPPSMTEIQELVKVINAVQLGGGNIAYNTGLMQSHQKGCQTRNYTVEDQKTAGCQPMDTLAQCGIKLYKHCVTSYFGYANFQKSAKEQLAEAEKLQALLTKYRTRIQDAVNAYTP